MDNEIENLINSTWNNVPEEFVLLRTRFEEKLIDRGISAFQAEKTLGIEYKSLNRLLDGNFKKFDLLSLIKIGHFVGISEKAIAELFTSYLTLQNKDEIEQVRKSTFILDNFDLPTLKSLGVINNTADFNHIENQINAVLGLNSILEYNPDIIGAALSSTRVKPKNEKNRNYFKFKSRKIFLDINNPHPYDKQALIDYFPKIRWHSTVIDKGLVDVIRSLYKLGITVVFQPKFPLLQLRGATFEVNGKPCIVLTDYRNSYPTLWFAFLHELFHVLFDWDEILKKRYHLSDEENDLYVLRHKEEEANEFAREYLFPSKKFQQISNRIHQKAFINGFAFDNHVHPSIVYANFSFLNSTSENNLWQQFDKLIRPPMESLIRILNNQLTYESSAAEFAAYYRESIYKNPYK